MRGPSTLLIMMAVAGLAACGSNYGTGGGGGGGGGGPVGSVTVGPGIQFVSGHNGTSPAVDTILAGATATWTWSGTLPHSVRSTGTPRFSSSGTLTGSRTYAVRVDVPGTYRYDCVVHGAAMTGTIVVR